MATAHKTNIEAAGALLRGLHRATCTCGWAYSGPKVLCEMRAIAHRSPDCEACSGTGRHFGGHPNSPGLRDLGRCLECNGTGSAVQEDACG